MAKNSPVERLTRAVLDLEKGLVDLDSQVQSYANELVKAGDELARQLSNDIQILLKGLVDEIHEELERQKAAVRSYYAEREKEELDKIHRLGEANLEEAVKAVVEEIIKIVEGV